MDLSVSLRVVLPLVIYMAVGRVCRLKGILDVQTSGKLNAFCFRILLPCSMFNSIVRAKDSFGGQTMGFVLAMVGFTLAAYLLLELTVPRAVADPPRAGSFIQGCIRGNSVLFAMAVAESLYAGNDTVTGAVSVAVSILVPLYNVLAVILFERRRSRERTGVLAMLGSILTTPITIAALLGFAVVLLNLPMPRFLTKAVNDLAACSNPLALAVIGANLDLTPERKSRRHLAAVCFIKLVLSPLLALLLTRALGFPDAYAAVAVVTLFVPAAVSSYPFAVNMGGDGPFSASVVAYTTVLSIFTSIGWITALQLMGLT